jgi:tetratricopeptide (TPR) repeat protein
MPSVLSRKAFVSFRWALLISLLGAAGWLIAVAGGCRPASQPGGQPAGGSAGGLSAGAADPQLSKDLANFNRGVALLEQYEYAKSVEALTPVVAAHPDWTAARFDLGLALLNNSQNPEALKQAEKEFHSVLEREPDHRWALFCLAKLYQTNGNTEKAVECSQKVYQLDQENPYVAYHHAMNLAGVGKTDEAIRVLQPLVQRDPGFVSATFYLGGLYRRTRQPDKAKTLLESYTQRNAKELVAGSFRVADPYGGHGKYYAAIGADGLPIAAARLSPAPKIVFSPDVVKLDVTLKPWKWSGGEVQTPGVAVGDLDGDGDLDLIVCGVGDDGAAVALLNDGKGGFTVGPRLADKAVSPCLGDVNNDGNLDLWLGRAGENLLLINDGKGNFTKAKDQPAATGSTLTVCARMLDLDYDGDLDLLAVRIAGGGRVPQPQPVPVQRESQE